MLAIMATSNSRLTLDPIEKTFGEPAATSTKAPVACGVLAGALFLALIVLSCASAALKVYLPLTTGGSTMSVSTVVRSPAVNPIRLNSR